MATLWEQLRDFWCDAGLTIRPGVTLDELTQFELQYGVRLPGDLRMYFLTVDGMEDDLDPGMNRFWPLNMVKPVEDELKDINPDQFAYPGCFVIADHLIWSFGWAVKLDNNLAQHSGPIFQVTGSSPPGGQIASSFTAVVEMYLKDQYSIL